MPMERVRVIFVITSVILFFTRYSLYLKVANIVFRYKYDVDKHMVQLKFVDTNNKAIGMISWFAIHPTSMNYTNRLVSSDNVGYASVLFEKKMNRKHNLIGKVIPK